MERDETDMRIFLSLGTNLGDRRANLREAIERVKQIGLDVVGESAIYETEPVGYADQGWFLNQVIEVRLSDNGRLIIAKEDETHIGLLLDNGDGLGAQTALAGAILRALLRIEDRMGRRRTFKNAPRVIDIDLLLFGDLISTPPVANKMARADLIVPHPRMRERRFVLEPLVEIAPDLTDPLSQKPFAEILATLQDASIVRRLRWE